MCGGATDRSRCVGELKLETVARSLDVGELGGEVGFTLCESVAIVDEDTVQITCAADVPAGATLGYAATSDGAAVSGVSPRWGQLKDSDPFVGDFTQLAQPNFAVAFELNVP